MCVVRSMTKVDLGSFASLEDGFEEMESDAFKKKTPDRCKHWDLER